MENILLHTCCGICGFSATQNLEKSFNIKYYWYNPNIHLVSEYKKRLASAKTKFTFIIDTYDWKKWFLRIKNIAYNNIERCKECYIMRLTKTAEKAKELKINNFSSTLLISPYQKHDLLKNIGEDLQKRFNVKFHYFDERKNFYKYRNQYREFGLYMQKYCGCVFSKPR